MRKPKRQFFLRSVARPAAIVLALAATVIWPSGAFAQQGPLNQQANPSTLAMPPLAVKAEPPPAAPATEAAPTFDAKFSAGITSDYNYRGYTLSDHHPSVSANIEALHRNEAQLLIQSLSQSDRRFHDVGCAQLAILHALSEPDPIETRIVLH